MNRPTLFRTTVFLGLSAGAVVSSPLRAASLSDLEAFTQSAGNAKRVLSDRTVQSNYRKTLQRYLPNAGPSTQDFDKVWEQLAKLRKQVGTVNERLMAERKPMAILYSGKPSIRFERVRQPFHSVWLLESMREPETACASRDALLVDRWTPLLQDASLFTVEKDGKFTGASLMMVPVRSGSSSYLLVSASDRSSQIPPKLLEAFLRDYRGREPRALPFALLTKENGAYRLHRVDSQGHKAGALGPVEGFQLVDPTARRITDTVPTRCAPKSVAMNSAPSPREVAAMAQPSAPVTVNVTPGAGASNFSGAADIAKPSETKPAAAPSAQDRKLQEAPSDAKSPIPLSSNGGPGKPVVNNVVNNNQFSPQVQGGQGYPPPQLVDFGRGDRGPASVAGQPLQGGGPLPGNRFGAPPVVNAPTNVASAGSGAGAQANPIQNFTANDRRLLDAMQAGRNALEAGKPVPRGTIEDIARGSLITQNPDLKKEAEKSISEMYYKGDPMETYQALRNVQSTKPQLARNLIAQLNSDLCTYCVDCSYCRALRERAEGAKKQ